MSYQIFSDGACDLSDDILQTYNIKEIPFYVSFDGILYQKEKYELSVEDFYAQFSGDVLPKTSLPSISDFEQAFRVSLEEGKDVLCFTISSKLSGSVQSAENAKMILEEEFPDRKIVVIDSELTTIAQGLLVIEVGKMQQAGYSFDEICEKAHMLRDKSIAFFYVSNLHHLEKGGRIGQVSYLLGSILKIIPVIRLDTEGISVAHVVRSQKKAVAGIVSVIKNYFESINESLENYIFAVGSTMIEKDAKELYESLKEFVNEKDLFPISTIGATTATHTGPTTVGVGIVRKFETI